MGPKMYGWVFVFLKFYPVMFLALCHVAAFLLLHPGEVLGLWMGSSPRAYSKHTHTHTRTCIAAPHAACHARAVCRCAQKVRMSQARFECLPIFPPCLSQTGRKSSIHCSRVTPHMKTQCVALMGSVDCFSYADRDRKRGP